MSYPQVYNRRMPRETRDQPIDLYPVKPFTNNDVTSLMGLEKEAFPIDHWSQESFQRILDEKLPSEHIVVIKDRGQVIGYVFITTEDDVPCVGSIAVLKAYQGKGLGRKLFSYALDQLKNSGASRIVIQTRIDNVSMQDMAGTFGFEKTRTIKEYYQNDKADAFEYVLLVDQAPNSVS